MLRKKFTIGDSQAKRSKRPILHQDMGNTRTQSSSIKLKPNETLAKGDMFILRSADGSTVLLALERCEKCTKTAIGTYVANVYEGSDRLCDVTKGEIEELRMSSGFGW